MQYVMCDVWYVTIQTWFWFCLYELKGDQKMSIKIVQGFF